MRNRSKELERSQNGIQALVKGLALTFLKYKRKKREMIYGYISKFVDLVIRNLAAGDFNFHSKI